MTKPILPRLWFACLLISTAHADCKRVIDGFCADTHAELSIDPAAKGTRFDVQIGIGASMTVRLPEGAEALAVSNVGVVDVEYDPKTPTMMLLVSRVPKQRPDAVMGLTGDVSFELRGRPVTVRARVAKPDAAASRLTLRHPRSSLRPSASMTGSRRSAPSSSRRSPTLGRR